MTKGDKLKQFLTDNRISFDFGERNSASTVVAGFALHIGFDEGEKEDILDIIERNCVCDPDWDDEFERIFKFAARNNYGEWWKSKTAKNTYTF